MKKFKRFISGFTLIEIIVVLIIVGILASIALPNLFNNVVQQRAQEALGSISSFRPTVEACISKSGGVADDTACASATLGSPAASANFTYALSGPSSATDTNYSITATGQGALTDTDTLIVSRGTAATQWPSLGGIICVGSGHLLGAC